MSKKVTFLALLAGHPSIFTPVYREDEMVMTYVEAPFVLKTEQGEDAKGLIKLDLRHHGVMKRIDPSKVEAFLRSLPAWFGLMVVCPDEITVKSWLKENE